MRFLLTLCGGLLVGAGLLFFLQHRMIYYPRSYAAGAVRLPGLIERAYETAAGRQTAFFLPPRDGRKMPAPLWLVFGGNASLALDWQDFLASYPDPAAGFLLIDYPGYGHCQGQAGPETILASAEAALFELSRYLRVTPAELDEHLAILGHSLGAAAGLMVAARHPVERVVLVSPFTSLSDMAIRAVGRPFHLLLRHHYDNRARLAEIVRRPQPPAVVLFHGSGDEVIPVTMGRELAALFPAMVQYREVRGGDHNGIVHLAERDIHTAMRGKEFLAPVQK